MKKELKYDIDTDGVVSEWTKTIIENNNVRTVNNERTIKCEPGDDISDAKDEIKALLAIGRQRSLRHIRQKLN